MNSDAVSIWYEQLIKRIKIKHCLKNESKLGNKAFRLCCSFGLRMKVEMEMMNILFVFVFIINKK